MKKIIRVISVFIVITILAACSEVKMHEEVDKSLANDSLKFVDAIMNNLDKNVKRDDVSKNDERIIAHYHEKYIENADPLEYADEEANKEILLASMLAHIVYMEHVEMQEDEIDEFMQSVTKTINWYVENGNKEAPIF